MWFTEAFCRDLSFRLRAQAKDAHETSERLWRLLDPEEGGPGNTQDYPPNGGWLNAFGQAATTALISARGLQAQLEVIRMKLEHSAELERAREDLKLLPGSFTVTWCTECARKRGLVRAVGKPRLACCDYCVQERTCSVVPVSVRLSGKTEQLVKAEIQVAAEREAVTQA